MFSGRRLKTQEESQNADTELKAVCDFFGDDLKEATLACELQILRELFTQKGGSATPTTAVLRNVLTSLTASQGDLISSVWRLYQLLLVLPATNATSERTFSALRRVKSYLRRTMAQARLNHLIVLHYHRDRTDKLSLSAVGNEYIQRHKTSMATFAKFA